MQLSDLWNSRVRTLAGERLGRVHDVQVDKGRIVALVCGPASLIERLTAKRRGRRLLWECVTRVSGGEVLVTPDPPQRKPAKALSASNRRPRKPRPST